MKPLIALGKAIGRALFLLLAAPFLLAGAWFALAVTDVFARRREPPDSPPEEAPRRNAVSVVIPTWNGRGHLARNLPSVTAAVSQFPGSEVIVVDNGSEDGTAEFLAREFPEVRVLRFEQNLGFGAGSNQGFRAARNDVVVLLNNDMRVSPDFAAPLLEGFRDPRVFAVTCQIFFSDPRKRREETGLVHARWVLGRLELRHIEDDRVRGLFPTFYAGGGSTAFDRRKVLELGGFDPLLEPFYYEDTDLSLMAWKRGWFVLYEPRSVVYHDHRGTIGRRFPPWIIDTIVRRNHLLFLWKNVHEKGRLTGHFLWLWASLWVSLLAGPGLVRPGLRAFLGALKRLPAAVRARARARRLARITDTEALQRPLGGFFRDRFGRFDPERSRLRVLFFSPYPIEPPTHGGGVFMNQTVRRLREHCDVHLLSLVDRNENLASNERFGRLCASAEFLVRWAPRGAGIGALLPFAAQRFYHPGLEWKLHRALFEHDIDAIQIEYTQMAVYARPFRRMALFLFEHDIYFQSVWRALLSGVVVSSRWDYFYEYLRALRWERRVLRLFDEVHVCTAENRRYLQSYAWNAPPVVDGLRAGIDLDRYSYSEDGREADTLLFVGNFRHPPNTGAAEFLAEEVLPRVRAKRPQARLIIAGAEATPSLIRNLDRPGVEFKGKVADVRDELRRYAVFAAPIRTGSGVRVKLLEAFAAGIPVVSTRLGAEGLLDGGAQILELAESAEEFAAKTVALLADRERAKKLALRAREEVERRWDIAAATGRLASRYREALRKKALTAPSEPEANLRPRPHSAAPERLAL